MSSARKQPETLSTDAPPGPLRPENQQLLEFLEKFMAEPDDLGEAWWDDFERWLRENRVRFRPPKDP